MRFRNFYQTKSKENISEFINELFLTEASIFASKYQIGSKVTLKNDKIKTFNNKLPSNAKSVDDSPFEKVNRPNKSIPIDMGSDDEEVYLNHLSTNQIFHIVGSSSQIGGLFNHVKEGAGISWKDVTLETGAVLGLFIDGNKLLDYVSDPDKTKKSITDDWIKQIKSAFANGEDWNSKGTQNIGEKLNGMGVTDWAELASLAAGMTTFREKIVGSKIKKIHVIHGKIENYYDAEKQNPFLEQSGSKENTADTIVSSVPADALISVISKSKVITDRDGLCSIGDIKFYQVSLKKAKGQAQLGKIFGLLRSKYGVPSFEKLLDVAMSEGFASDIISKLKKVGSDIINKIKNIAFKFKEYTLGFVSAVNSKIQSQFIKDTKELSDILDIPQETLLECLQKDGSLLIEKEMNLYEELQKVSKDKNKMQKLYDATNNRLDNLIKTSDKIEGVYHKTDRIRKIPSNIGVEDIKFVFTNFTTFYILNEIISNESNKGKKLLNDIIELQKEMLFGSTSLPLYKVYGISSSGETSYEFLKTGKEFSKEKLKEFGVGKKGTLIIGIRVNSSSDKYYVIISHMIFGISEEDGSIEYSIMRTGSNQGPGKFSYTIEGSTLISYEKVKKEYGIN